jgi:hypothetical protein
MEISEKRVHTRAQFFRLGTGANATSMFAFRDEANPQSIAALVLDISEGGLQILSHAGALMPGKAFQLELVVSPSDASEKLVAGDVQWVWSRPEGIYTRSGFVMQTDASRLSTLVATLHAADQQMLRCVLHPLSRQALG